MNSKYMNLGIGIPTLIPTFLDLNITIYFHTEIVVVGLVNYPIKGQELGDLVNAGKESITLNLCSSKFLVVDYLEWQEEAILIQLYQEIYKQINKVILLIGLYKEEWLKEWEVLWIQLIRVLKFLLRKKLLNDITLPITGLKRVDQFITDKAVLLKEMNNQF
ncbi:unnamed protein product [Paramecium sonneborni]|uniref:Uncharacterized protein n=1 Tax=Paramecium sonneborni TaxID=65129 RepID=A0A8S1NU75_9CILI|nr:unnamed protein product [Paramecium sonneborni]